MVQKESRIEKIMATLLSLEERFDVGDWTYEGVQLWPLIKHVTFFDFKEGQAKVNSKVPLNKIFSLIKKKIKNRLNLLLAKKNKVKLSNLTQADILFCGANSHYAFWDNYNMNRYFDPIMDEIDQSSIYFNYSIDDLPKLYKKERYHNIYSFYEEISQSDSFKSAQFNTKDFKDYLLSNQAIAEVTRELNSKLDIPLESFNNNLISKLETIIKWKNFWLAVVDKVKPKVGLVLCYYDPIMYGLILALKEKGIPSVDMQHGGQGVGHPAYSYAPQLQKTFNLIPDYFWVWDEVSANNIESWASQTKHNFILGGNPWLRLFQSKRNVVLDQGNEKYITCTLPADKAYYNLLPDSLAKAIADSGPEYKFGFRFHPKTTDFGKKNVMDKIAKLNLTSKVDFLEANAKPLPYLYAKSWAHISVGSIGSIAEAAIIGVNRNVILDKIGVKYYSKLIDDKKAQYFDVESNVNLYAFLHNIPMELDKITQQLSSYNDFFKKIMDGK